MRLEVERLPALTAADIDDLCASFQAAVVDVIVDRTRAGLAAFGEVAGRAQALVAAGGVAANGMIRRALGRFAAESGLTLVVPPPALCTDNGAMIAWAGIERLQSRPERRPDGRGATPLAARHAAARRRFTTRHDDGRRSRRGRLGHRAGHRGGASRRATSVFWGRDPDAIAAIAGDRERTPGICRVSFSPRRSAPPPICMALAAADLILAAVPAQALRATLLHAVHADPRRMCRS